MTDLLFYVDLRMEKSKVLNAINEFPENFDLDQFIERLIFIDKVEKGLQQARDGKTISHDQVKSEIQKW